MVDGTAVDGKPDDMNWRTAIWAVASCIATLSGLNFRYDSPRMMDDTEWGSSRWQYTTFSAKVKGLFNCWRTIFKFLLNFVKGNGTFFSKIDIEE